MSDRMLSDEILLALIKKNSSGGGGTSDYNQLENLPKIGGETLIGNMSLADLGIASATDLASVAAALADKQNVLLYGGTNPSTGADGDMYVKLARDESTLIDMFGSPSAESTDDYEMSYTVDSSVMGDYYDYEAFGTGKGFGQNGRGSMTITYHFKNSKYKPANVSYCNNFNLSGGGYLESANFTIKASNDGTNWDTLYTTTYPCPRDTIVSADIATNTYYSYFKFEMNSGGGYTGIRNIVMNGISESYSNIDNIYFKNGGTWLKDSFAKKSDVDAAIAEIKPVDYSTTEYKTGRKWIDGRDIYGRVYVLKKDGVDQYARGGLDNKEYLIGLDDVVNVWVDRIQEYRAIGTNNIVDSRNMSNEIITSFDLSTGGVYYSTTHAPTDITVVLEYTKTT